MRITSLRDVLSRIEVDNSKPRAESRPASNASGSAGSHGIQDAREVIEDNSAKLEITEGAEEIVMDVLAGGQDPHEVHKVEVFPPTSFASILPVQEEIQIEPEGIVNTSQQPNLYEQLEVVIDKKSGKEPSPATVLPSQSEDLDQFMEELMGNKIEPVIDHSEHMSGSNLGVVEVVEKNEARSTLRSSLNSDISNDDFLGISHGFNDGSSLDLGSRPPEEIYQRGSSNSRRENRIIDEEQSNHNRHVADVEVTWVFNPFKLSNFINLILIIYCIHLVEFA